MVAAIAFSVDAASRRAILHIAASASARKAARRRFRCLTLPVAEAFVHLSFAAAHLQNFRRILRVSLKSRVDFLFASGIKEVLERNAKLRAASQRPRVASGVKRRVCIL
jgi:hypothetical protein